jgi:ABC-type phosphate transport system substrate-binding protein
MNMRFVQFLILICIVPTTVLFNSCRCDSENRQQKREMHESAGNEEVSGLIRIDGDDIMFQLMNDLSSGFRKKYPNVMFEIAFSNSAFAFNALETSECDLIFVSTPATSVDPGQYSVVPLAKDKLVLIVNFNNDHLQTLVRNGISRKVLGDILQLKIADWQDVHSRIEESQPLKIFIPPGKSGTLDYLSDFTGVKNTLIKAEDVIAEKDIPVNVANMQIAMGICSHTLAYDHSTNLRKSGIYIVGIDVNNSGFLENEELIYDDLDELSVAVKHGTAPSELVREFSMIYRNDNSKAELLELFVHYVQQNGHQLIEQLKFYPAHSKK